MIGVLWFMDARRFKLKEVPLPNLRLSRYLKHVKWCRADSGYWFVLFYGRRVIGVALLQVGSGGVGKLWAGHVHPRFRGRRFQTALIHARVEKAVSLGCRTVELYLDRRHDVSIQNALVCGFRLRSGEGGKPMQFFERHLK
jgi:GNAT superfamily N-acetyltransferase